MNYANGTMNFLINLMDFVDFCEDFEIEMEGVAVIIVVGV